MKPVSLTYSLTLTSSLGIYSESQLLYNTVDAASALCCGSPGIRWSGTISTATGPGSATSGASQTKPPPLPTAKLQEIYRFPQRTNCRTQRSQASTLGLQWSGRNTCDFKIGNPSHSWEPRLDAIVRLLDHLGPKTSCYCQLRCPRTPWNDKQHVQEWAGRRRQPITPTTAAVELSPVGLCRFKKVVPPSLAYGRACGKHNR